MQSAAPWAAEDADDEAATMSINRSLTSDGKTAKTASCEPTTFTESSKITGKDVAKQRTSSANQHNPNDSNENGHSVNSDCFICVHGQRQTTSITTCRSIATNLDSIDDDRERQPRQL